MEMINQKGQVIRLSKQQIATMKHFCHVVGGDLVRHGIKMEKKTKAAKQAFGHPVFNLFDTQKKKRTSKNEHNPEGCGTSDW